MIVQYIFSSWLEIETQDSRLRDRPNESGSALVLVWSEPEGV